MSKKHKQQDAPAKPKMVRADKLICGDEVKMSKSVLMVDDIVVAGETRIVTLRMQSGGSIDVTYHCDEPVEIVE